MKRSHPYPLFYSALLTAGVLLAAVAGLEGSAQAEISGGSVSAGGGGAGAGIGVGASAFVGGVQGAQIVYDTSKWHIEGLISFDTHNVTVMGNSRRQTQLQFGFSGWFHLNLGASSDFSLGGGFALVTTSGPGASAVAEVVEPGAQVRVFVTSNVAVHGLVALPLVFGDSNNGVSNHVGLNGQVIAGFGFTYFFR